MSIESIKTTLKDLHRVRAEQNQKLAAIQARQSEIIEESKAASIAALLNGDDKAAKLLAKLDEESYTKSKLVEHIQFVVESLNAQIETAETELAEAHRADALAKLQVQGEHLVDDAQLLDTGIAELIIARRALHDRLQRMAVLAGEAGVDQKRFLNGQRTIERSLSYKISPSWMAKNFQDFYKLPTAEIVKQIINKDSPAETTYEDDESVNSKIAM